MPARFPRSACTAALAAALALALPAPAAPAATPGPGPSASPPAPPSAPPSAAPSPSPSPPAAPDPAAGPAELLKQLQSLYRTTEESARAYRATLADLKRAQAQAGAVNTRLASARARLAKGRADAGRLARLQYQGTASAQLSSSLRVLLAKDPQQAMEQGHFLSEAAGDQAAVIARLTGAEKQAAALAGRARTALGRQQQLTARSEAQHAAVQRRLAEVEKLLASLSADRIAELSRLEAADGAAQPPGGEGAADGGAAAFGLGQAGTTAQAGSS